MWNCTSARDPQTQLLNYAHMIHISKYVFAINQVNDDDVKDPDAAGKI